eukprot:CAMPEP_0174820906 /NCGR_PEP_ID=MMETSP1107-20130205/5029_1 /TAXON_ID=36770 /ORGANISM="Paraphysomonas vestita, Strain GFlagA" /LENGTH=180 /DNA_ID=CAMNT_0016037141 /DNA_START=605 /DNA_END=1144 /DNA_ORIENTATION=-
MLSSTHECDVFVVHLPGRFERHSTASYPTFKVAVQDISQELFKHNLVDNSTPLIFIGYSFGTYLAHDCARYLLSNNHFEVQHIISIAGIPKSNLRTSKTYEEIPGENSIEKLKNLFFSIHGYVPDYFQSHGIHRIATPFIEDIKFSQEWMNEFHEGSTLNINFTWMVGLDDKTTKDELAW